MLSGCQLSYVSTINMPDINYLVLDVGWQGCQRGTYSLLHTKGQCGVGTGARGLGLGGSDPGGTRRGGGRLPPCAARQLTQRRPFLPSVPSTPDCHICLRDNIHIITHTQHII